MHCDIVGSQGLGFQAYGGVWTDGVITWTWGGGQAGLETLGTAEQA